MKTHHLKYRRRYDETEVNPILFLANGVTYTFPAGKINPDHMMELRQKINRGERIGPRIFNTGPYFGASDPDWDRNYTTEDIYRIVDQLADMFITQAPPCKTSATPATSIPSSRAASFTTPKNSSSPLKANSAPPAPPTCSKNPPPKIKSL